MRLRNNLLSRVFTSLFIILATFLFSGCSLLGDVTQISCGFISDGKNQAHCYQQAALQKNDETLCDKAPQADEFKKAGSNPPQDKCYYMVAQNKQNPQICKKIKGGLLSYSMEECIDKTVEIGEKTINEKLTKAQNGEKLSPEELQKIQTDLSTYSQMTNNLSNVVKTMHDNNMSIVKNFR